MANTALMKAVWGSEKLFCIEKCSKSVCKIMLPTAARSTCLKTCDSKRALEHTSYEGGILQLALFPKQLSAVGVLADY